MSVSVSIAVSTCLCVMKNQMSHVSYDESCLVGASVGSHVPYE